MADTDDELQSGELDSDQRDDDTAETASERRRARWIRDAEAAGLTPNEEALRREEDLERLREEDEAADLRKERIEVTDREERDLREARDRDDLLDTKAKAETTRAMRLADVDEASSDLRRRDAAAGRLEGRRERSRGDHLIAEADSRRDEPGAEATAAAGRAHHRRANDADRRAVYDDRDADRDAARARDRRSEATQVKEAEAPAVGAVQTPPEKPPVARTYRRPLERKKKQERDTSGLPDLDIGGR